MYKPTLLQKWEILEAPCPALQTGSPAMAKAAGGVTAKIVGLQEKLMGDTRSLDRFFKSRLIAWMA